MNGKKWQFIPFSFYDRTGMVKHLEKMALQGWMIEKISNWGWFYEKIEPRRIHFAVSFFPRASEFDPEPTEEQLIFQDFCERTGWKMAAASGQMQIFYNEEEDPLPIETEPAVEVEQISRAGRRVLPLYWGFLVLGFCMGGSWCYSLFHNPIDLLASATNLFTGLCWLVLFVVNLAELVTYYTWRRRARRAAKIGEFVPTRGCGWMWQVALWVVLIGLVYWFAAAREPGIQWGLAAMMGMFVLLNVVVNGTKNFLKRKKVSARRNRMVTLIVDVGLAMVLMVVLTAGLLHGINSGWFSMEEYVKVPLTVEDLTGTEDSRYVDSSSVDLSVFLSRGDYRSFVPASEGVVLPGIEYIVVKVHMPFLYAFCFDQMYGDFDGWTDETGQSVYRYEASDSAPWGAEEAYQLWTGDMPVERYLLCYSDRIVTFRADWTLTEAEMAAAGERLKTY